MFVLYVCVYLCFANKFICIIFLVPQLILYDYVELANAEFFYYLKKTTHCLTVFDFYAVSKSFLQQSDFFTKLEVWGV